MRLARSKLVVFLCTGNFYRSRFAEILFEHEARRAGLDWWAISRGLDVTESRNAGAISPWTVLALARHRIPIGEPRAPMQVAPSDLQAADLVIAMSEAEHQPFFAAGFSAFASHVEYWNVLDVAPSALYDPLAAIDGNVRSLVRRIALEATPVPALAS